MTDSRSAFFYGTLMVPQVLHRVCHGGMDPQNPIFATHKLKTYPAVLHDYQRHRVRHADYPAILPKTGSTVRGTYVTGLTDADIWRLDIFEGWMYRRDKVQVRILTVFGDSEGKDNVEGELAEAETYVWSASPQDLEDREWDFTEFQREKMHFWVGADGEEEYAGTSYLIKHHMKLQI